MAEPVRATCPDLPALELGERVRVRLAAPCARFALHGDNSVATIIGEAFGAAPPRMPLRAETRGERAALWLGPDEWLLIAPDMDAETLGRELRLALAGSAHALVDISDRDIGFDIEGAAAALLLNAGVPLDLDLTAFPVGMCARTVFIKTGVLLWRTAPDRFRLETPRSYAAYVHGFLAASLPGLPE